MDAILIAMGVPSFTRSASIFLSGMKKSLILALSEKLALFLKRKMLQHIKLKIKSYLSKLQIDS